MTPPSGNKLPRVARERPSEPSQAKCPRLCVLWILITVIIVSIRSICAPTSVILLDVVVAAAAAVASSVCVYPLRISLIGWRRPGPAKVSVVMHNWKIGVYGTSMFT